MFLLGNALQFASHLALARLAGDAQRRSEKTAYRIPRGGWGLGTREVGGIAAPPPACSLAVGALLFRHEPSLKGLLTVAADARLTRATRRRPDV